MLTNIRGLKLKMSWNDREIDGKLSLVNWRGNWIYLASSELIPTRQHEIRDQIIEKERELGGMLRFQRDLEGRYP